LDAENDVAHQISPAHQEKIEV